MITSLLWLSLPPFFRRTSTTPPPPLLYSCHRANTFACDESRASGAISRDAGAINSLQISLYRRDDGPVLISLYYPRLLSCGYAVTRPIHPRVLACHRAGVRTAKLSVISLLLLYLSEDGEDASARICRNGTEDGRNGGDQSAPFSAEWSPIWQQPWEISIAAIILPSVYFIKIERTILAADSSICCSLW